jgi:uncharacterized membrane protein
MKIKPLLNKLINNPGKCFLILALPIGLLSVFLIPPLAGNDEISHFSRAYEIANGQMFTKKMTNGNFGGEIPTTALKLYWSNSIFDPLKVDKFGIKDAKQKANIISINSSDKTLISYSGSALYSPISYLPHSMAIFTAKLFNLSILQTIYLIRIVTLVFFLSFVSLAIYISPIKKWLFFAVGTMPMSLLLAGNITLDGLVISSALLIAAILARILVTKKVTVVLIKKNINLLPLLCVLSIYFALTKPIYSPLLILNILALNQVYKFKSKQWVRWVALTVLFPVILMFFWNFSISAVGIDSGPRIAVNSVGIYPPTKEEAIKDFITHPVQPVKIFIHTFIDSYQNKQDIPNYILGSFSGKFTEYRISPADWLNVSVILSLILAFSLQEKEKYGFSKRVRITTLITILIGTLGVIASMYLYATGRGASEINGIQGRYFIPFIPFFLFLVSNNRLLVFTKNNKNYYYNTCHVLLECHYHDFSPFQGVLIVNSCYNIG